MKLKKFLILAFIFIGVLITSGGSVSAASNTTVIKKSDGSDLTYLDGSGKVMRLTEYTYPTQDFRGVWISNYANDLASYANETQYKNEIDAILDNMEEYGLNVMMFHIRMHNDALYDSKLNPRRNYWHNVNFDQFDPLTYIIEEAHKRGIEFHAWLNPYRVLSSGLDTDLETFAASFRSMYPEFPNNPAGNPELIVKAGEGVYLNPGEPAVRKHILDTIDEIINKYDVDAIHFDDYFYNGISDSQDNKTYSKPGYNPKGLGKADWRRDQVNLLMAGIDELLDQHFKHTGKVVQLGISPTGVYRNDLAGTIGAQQHYSALYCDSVAWIQNEWIDYLLPQTYWGLEHNRASFAQLSKFWSGAAEGYNVNMYLGHGIYMAPGSGWGNVDELQNRILNMEMYDRIDGSAFYKYSFFRTVATANEQIKRGLTLLKEDYWAKKVPGSVVRSYKDLVPVRDVTNMLVHKINDNQNLIRWDKIDDVRGYVVYRTLKDEQLDVNNIDHLYEYIQTNELVVENNDNYKYYVSTVNKANVISTPMAVNHVIDEDDPGFLDIHKDFVIRELNKYVNLEEYSAENQAVIEGIIANAITAINNATSKDEVNLEFENAKALIDAVLTIKGEAKAEIVNYVNFDLYSEEDKEYLESIIDFTKNSIDRARTIEEVEMLVDIFKGWVDEVAPIYSEERQAAKNELDNYVNLNNYSEENQDKIIEIIDNAKAEIDKAMSVDKINEIVKKAKADINKVPKLNNGGSNCQSGVVLIPSFIGALGVLYIITRRKR
ncbi:MAG: family 10 glycosylhydrolase [Bacilli bacterium]|jgi:uncharacterized lipoprotein YddW (UPF0748 family)